MKFPTLIAIFAATSSFAFAQEDTPAPAEPLGLRGADAILRSEPTVSVPSETKSPEYPVPGEPLATPKPKAGTSKAAKRETASSPTPHASASPAAPAAKKNAQAMVRELENKWAQATSTHDLTAVQALLAGDYVGVTANGKVVNKAGLLAGLRKDKNAYESVVNSRLDVRVHGETAIVVGTTKQKGKDASGKAFSVTYRWTDTWMERDEQWQCIASQSIQVPG